MFSNASDPVHIPSSLDGIDAAWLAQILQTARPELQVHSAEQGDIQHGTCTKVRLRIKTSDPNFPSSVMLKGGFEPHSALMAGMHMNEMRAYRDYLPSVQANRPQCYFAGASEDGRAVVVMEDLRPSAPTFLNLLEPIGYDLAARFLEELAQTHAVWWGSRELDRDGRFNWAPRPVEGRYIDYMNRLTAPEHFERFRRAPRGAATPRALTDPDKIRRGLVAMRDSYGAQPRVMCHGDTHLGNLYVDRAGRPGFLDWSVRIAPWQNEIAYFLTAALDTPDRRKWERPLIGHYLAHLRANGITPPPFDAAFEAYQRDVMWGFFIWLLNDSAFQPEAVNCAGTARFAAAMLDHDTYARLGVA